MNDKKKKYEIKKIKRTNKKKTHIKKRLVFFKMASTNDLFVRLAAPRWLIPRNCHPLLTSGNKNLRNRESWWWTRGRVFASLEDRCWRIFDSLKRKSEKGRGKEMDKVRQGWNEEEETGWEKGEEKREKRIRRKKMGRKEKKKKSQERQ